MSGRTRKKRAYRNLSVFFAFVVLSGSSRPAAKLKDCGPVICDVLSKSDVHAGII
jgi:hypothetical protein